MSKKTSIQTCSYVECIFGVRCLPFTAKTKDFPKGHYWTSKVFVVQKIKDRVNSVPCYLVVDEVTKTIGIAVVNKHLATPVLWVNHNDFVHYESDEEKSSLLANYRNILLGK